MENITSAADIKNAIRFLEADQEVKGQLLRAQFNNTFESLKPVNMLKSAVQEISSSPFMMTNIAGAVAGLATGYFSKRVVFGASKNILKRMLGIALQFGVTNLIARHPADIASYGHVLLERLFHKKKPAADKP
jgi:hypothetical protein